ncbi:MAG: SEC-C domain-containing protein [Halanaerobiales bacterium]
MIATKLEAPCPCGSGLKYKDCCYPREQKKYKQTLDKIIDKIMELTKNKKYASVIQFALSRYLERLDLEEDEIDLATGIFEEIVYVALFDIYAFGDKRLIDVIREEKGDEFSTREKEIMDNWGSVLYSAYRLEDIDPIKGYYYQDILRDWGFYTRSDELLTTDMDIGDLFLGRVVRMGKEYQLLSNMEKISSSYRVFVSDFLEDLVVSYREFLKNRDTGMIKVKNILRSQSIDIMMISVFISLQTVETEFDIHESYYSIKEPSFIISKLERHSNIVRDEDNYLLWVGEESDQVKARIGIVDNELILQTQKREELEEGKKFIASVLGIAARHREDLSGQVDTSQLVETWKERLGFEDIPLEMMKNPEVILDDYMEVWLDKPLMILEGYSPREFLQYWWGKKLLATIFARLHAEGILGQGENFLIRLDLEKIRNKLGLDSILSVEPADEVEKLVFNNMGDYYTEIERRDAQLLWRDFLADQSRVRGKMAGWAAGLEYIISGYCNLYFTQQEIAAKYDVSMTTLSKRYRQILGDLKFIDM